MKKSIKRIMCAVLSVLMLVAVIPFSASAATVENPKFKLTVTEETASSVTISLDLVSGAFNAADFSFKANSGYKCTKIVTGSGYRTFRNKCEDSGKSAPIYSSNVSNGCVSFASTEAYNQKGSFICVTYSKSGTYKDGDVKVVFTSAVYMSGSTSYPLSPVLGLDISETSITLNYGKSTKLTTSANNCEWKTSNAKVATVDKDGNVKATGRGTAVITVTDGAESATCDVTVKFTFGNWLMYIFLLGFIWM